jgi:hypothetical protein
MVPVVLPFGVERGLENLLIFELFCHWRIQAKNKSRPDPAPYARTAPFCLVWILRLTSVKLQATVCW